MSEIAWYVVKGANGQCLIVEWSEMENSLPLEDSEELTNREKWGPFDSPQTAIAKRVGLIRAGKCQPA